MNDPQDQEVTEEEAPKKESLIESALWVVDMMNQGKANPKDVYPPGRYHGD